MKTFGLKCLNKVRSMAANLVTEKTLDHLETIRKYELGEVLSLLSECGNIHSIIEIGAGTGWQAKILESRGYDVSAIDLPSSIYRNHRVRPVTEYDGHHIPFEDESFDVVFSSNVLEHVPHIHEFQKEIQRVLKPSGWAIHVLPSSSWRFWTNLPYILRFWSMPNKHGEHAGNAFTEIYYFSAYRWIRLFRDTGWIVKQRYSNRLFYTGYSILDSRLSIRMRKLLSYILGGSCNIFLLRKKIAINNDNCDSLKSPYHRVLSLLMP